MAHDPLFQARIADLLTAAGAKAEAKKMFGGVAFMVRGHMTIGITNKGDFMARFDPERHDEIANWPGAKPMTFGKAGMKGFLFVDATAVKTKPALQKWIALSLTHNASLPLKNKEKPVSGPPKKPLAATALKKRSTRR